MQLRSLAPPNTPMEPTAPVSSHKQCLAHCVCLAGWSEPILCQGATNAATDSLPYAMRAFSILPENLVYSGPSAPSPQRVTLRTLRKKVQGEAAHHHGHRLRLPVSSTCRLLPHVPVVMEDMATHADTYRPSASCLLRQRSMLGHWALLYSHGVENSCKDSNAASVPSSQARSPLLQGGMGMQVHAMLLCPLRSCVLLQVDQAGIDILLVGDSVAMVVHGHDTTLPVTVDEMLLHCKAVARGARR